MLLDIPINFNFLCMTRIWMMIMRKISLKRFNILAVISLTISLELKYKNVISLRYKFLCINDSLFMNSKFFFIFFFFLSLFFYSLLSHFLLLEIK